MQTISSLFGYPFDNTLGGIAQIINSREGQRLAQETQFWKYYNGRHYEYTTEDGGLPYINLCKAIVDKPIKWLLSKKPRFKFREEYAVILDEIGQEIIENTAADFFKTIMQYGGVTGNAFIQVYFDPNVNYGKGGIAFKCLDSSRVFVEYLNVGNTKTLSRVLITWDEIVNGQVKTVMELWDKDQVLVFPGGKLPLEMSSINGILPSFTNEKMSSYRNPYGELPFIHIQNEIVGNGIYGKSDLHDIYILNKEYNEAVATYKDNVDFTSNPITLLYGISAKNVEKGANRVWGNLPKDGRVENLSSESTHPQILEYIKILEKGIGMKLPMELLIPEQSNYTDVTNTGLRVKFLPLIEIAEGKKMTYGEGFKKAMEMALRFLNLFGQMNLESFSGPSFKTVKRILGMQLSDNQKYSIMKLLELRQIPYYQCNVIFEEIIPKNRMYELMDLDVELRNKLESWRGALERLGVTDWQSKGQEIMQDQQYIASLDAMYQAMATPPMPGSEFTTMMAQDNVQQSMPDSNTALFEDQTGTAAPEQAKKGMEQPK